ncbi:MAG: hypothetical protein QXU32_03755 [Nitrososphaerales archaeon]
MFVGLDVHRNYVQAAAMGEQGRIFREERIQNNMQDLQKFFANI